MIEALTRIADGLDVAPALAELAACEENWLEIMPGNHQIGLIAATGSERLVDDYGQCWALIDRVHEIAMREHGDRGRIGYARAGLLRPGDGVGRHRDGFDPAHKRRYQVILQSIQGAEFEIDETRISFASGEAWRVDVSRFHGVSNRSDRDRIILLFDTYA